MREPNQLNVGDGYFVSVVHDKKKKIQRGWVSDGIDWLRKQLMRNKKKASPTYNIVPAKSFQPNLETYYLEPFIVKLVGN